MNMIMTEMKFYCKINRWHVYQITVWCTVQQLKQKYMRTIYSYYN